MTRHRSPRGRGGSDELATISFPHPVARSGARHRSPGRSALRHGAVAVGITGTALAVVAPGALQAPVADVPDAAVAASLALSTQGAGLTPSSGAPVAPAYRGGAATADLIKASDRARATTVATTPTARTTPKAPVATPVVAAASSDDDASDAGGSASLDCGASGSYGGVKSSVKEVGNAIECVFPGRKILGVGSRGNASDHPSGYALDVMTTSGDAIADCVMDNADALGVSYVIWDRRINTGSGWKGMSDRGGATANHQDHVHISFRRGGSPDVSALQGCG